MCIFNVFQLIEKWQQVYHYHYHHHHHVKSQYYAGVQHINTRRAACVTDLRKCVAGK